MIESHPSRPDRPAAVFLDRRTPPHIATLVLLSGLSALSMNIFLPSLPAFRESPAGAAINPPPMPIRWTPSWRCCRLTSARSDEQHTVFT